MSVSPVSHTKPSQAFPGSCSLPPVMTVAASSPPVPAAARSSANQPDRPFANHSQPPPTTVLGTLQALNQVQQTRRQLQLELDQALESFLTRSPTSLASLQSPQAHDNDDNDDTATAVAPDPGLVRESNSCSNEVVRAPNVEEMQQVLKIGFEGLVDVRAQVTALKLMLEQEFNRSDLANRVGQIERLEASRAKEVSSLGALSRASIPTKGAFPPCMRVHARCQVSRWTRLLNIAIFFVSPSLSFLCALSLSQYRL